MSKRPRQIQHDANTVNASVTESENISEARPADHSRTEPKLVVSGAAFQEFDTTIDLQLEELVNRWIHTAAPAASSIRRVAPQDTPRQEQA